MKPEMKKLIIANLPYLLFVYLFGKLGQTYRLAAGADLSEKLLHLADGFSLAFESAAPSFHLFDLAVGVAGAVALRLMVYCKSKNAKKYRRGVEYGSARWGGPKDIAPYIDPVFDNNILLTQTERLTMNNRPKDPKTARNKNVLVIGGSGSGKTRFFVKPNLMQCVSKDYPTSFVITDPKGSLIGEVGQLLVRCDYRVKVLNTINFSKRIHELPAGAMEPLTSDRLDDFLEATEQANAIPQPQAWNGIDGLLNGKPFMPEASPADRAAALIELAEKNAPRLGSEERQLIVAYAEAVGDNDKVIGLINRLCEQGYELQKGQMDSFVKSEIESEIAVANAQRQIAQNPAAEPVVTILWSESPHLKDGQQMPLHEAEAVFKELDSARRHEREQPGYTGHWYDKTKFRIDFTMQGEPDSYEGRQDFGDGDGSLIQHIRGYHEYYAQDESWKNHVLHHEGPQAWEADKAQRDMLLHEFIPYMELHCNLSAMEQEARHPLRSGETLTLEQTAYFHAVLDYVKECRPLLNQSQYHLPEPPQLADFDQSLQDYKKQIEAELEQEAAAAGLTVEEYVASDYEAPAQPNFSIYQVPPGPEGRDFRYRSYEELQADGLSVDRKNYQLVYTAPLDKDTTLDEIYRRFNMEHPADYKGHSLSMGDIVVFRQDGKQTAYYVDEGADYRQVPEFFAQPEKQLTPDECMTGEQIQTPRGRFYLTDRSQEQMEAAGYGFHHQSEDGRYLIMANGTRAFAIPSQPESHIKTAEMSTEQNYNMIDGMMNNAPSMEELEARAKAGEQISLLDVAEAAKAEAKKPKQTRRTMQKQKKPSIRAQLAAAKEEQKKKRPAREKSKEMEV